MFGIIEQIYCNFNKFYSYHIRIKFLLLIASLLFCNCAGFLASQMVDPIEGGEIHKITSEDQIIYYYTVGDKKNPPIIFLHGILAFTEAYSELIEGLSEKYFVVGIDLRGHGRSSVEPISFSFKDISDDVIKVVGKLSIDSFYLVGHSAGGFLALELSKNYPARVIKMVSIASLYNSEGIKFHEQNDYLTKGGFKDNKNESKSYIINIFDNAYERLGEKEKFERTKAIMASHGKIMYPSFSDDEIKNIHTPVLVIVAENDTRIRPDHTIKMEKLLPNSNLLIVEKAHHFEITNKKKFIRILCNEIFEFFQDV